MRSSGSRGLPGFLALGARLTLALGLLTGVFTATAPPTRGSAQTRLPRAVGVRTEVFVDRSRKTPADSVAGIAPDSRRRLRTSIFYPARGEPTANGSATKNAKPRAGKYPLVIFNGGAPGSPEDYAPLLAEWAAAGYVVAAPEFPISSLAGPDDAAWKDLPRQSDDARFVLGRVLALDEKQAGIAEIDDDRIGVAGHSFGGATALSLIASCCRDRRIDAALVLAGVTETTDGPKLKGLTGPVLFVHSRGDRAVQYAPTLATCTTVMGWKRMLTIERLRGLRAHTQPFVGADEYAAVSRTAMIDFLDGYLRNEASARARLAAAGDGTVVGAIGRCTKGAVAEGDGGSFGTGSTTTTRPFG